MIALGALVIIVVVVAAVAFSRRRPSGADGQPMIRRRPVDKASSAVTASAPQSTRDVLERAVAGGRITRETADAILTDERERLTAATTGRRLAHGVPAVAESIGYVGGVLALLGAAFLVGRAWKSIGQSGRLGILGGVALLLLVVGLALRNEADPILWRLRAFVWSLSTAATGGFAGVLAVDTFHWRGERVVITVASSIAALSAVLWQGRDRPAQHASTMAGGAVALGALMSIWDGGGAIGAAIALYATVWALFGALTVLRPQYVAVPLGLAGLLIGPLFAATSFPKWAPLAGLVIAVGLIALGTMVHEFLVTGFGVIGLMIYTPYSITRWFGDTLKAPGVMLVSGVLLLALMLVIVKRRHGRPTTGHTATA